MEKRNYCDNYECNNEIDEPVMCCNETDCFCMGKPIEPPVCSQECFDICYPWSGATITGPRTMAEAAERNIKNVNKK